jgi:hypothetical protein
VSISAEGAGTKARAPVFPLPERDEEEAMSAKREPVDLPVVVRPGEEEKPPRTEEVSVVAKTVTPGSVVGGGSGGGPGNNRGPGKRKPRKPKKR